MVHALAGAGGPGQETPVPRVALLERHRCAQILLTPVGITCCLGLWRLMYLVPRDPSSHCPP